MWVIPALNYIGQQENAQILVKRVQNTLLGLNLNYSNPRQSSLDHRVDNRTATLDVVNLAIAQLSQVVGQIRTVENRGDADLEHIRVETLLHAIRETLRATGFWTLWAKRFGDVINNSTDALWSGYGDAARRRLLYRLLVEYEIDRRNLIKAAREGRERPHPLRCPGG